MVTDDNMGYVLSDYAKTPCIATTATMATTIKTDEPVDTSCGAPCIVFCGFIIVLMMMGAYVLYQDLKDVLQRY